MPDMHKTQTENEKEVLEYWDKQRIFERSVSERSKNKPYTFYDGPPFATGLPHYGHIVASVMKDVIPRFWTMRGYRVDRVWGWDCHGLPIENIIEKEFDLKSRKDIEAYGIGAFNDRCESKVLEYAEEWKKVVRRLGRWVDMENAYKTMDLPFMESIWWVFAELWKKGKIYEGHKSMHLCPRCETTLSNFEVAQGYADVTDLSATVTFELTSGPRKGKYVLAWTTTPWTLPGNVLLAVGADMEYAEVMCEEKTYILASSCIDRVFKGKTFDVGEKFAGSTLKESAYDPLFPYFRTHANGFRVVTADFVSDGDGTGIVHIAPGYGSDDMALGEAERVKPLVHVKTNGEFVKEIADAMTAEGYEVAGIPMKAKGEYSMVDVQIIKWLAHHGKLFSKEKFTHSYPHCWRCDTPLLNYATTSWFVRVSEATDDLLKKNGEIHWVPENMKEGRFGKWLEGARDWAISRSRYWGTPLPVWKTEDGELLVIGSVAELEGYIGHKVDNLHKHVVDAFEIVKDGKSFRRIPEVLDCWFESGSMPYAQLHYPFENVESFDAKFPADFIAEGQDQTRGWFYTLHVLAQALFDKPAFKNIIVNGIVLAEDGKKMSKKLKNYPDPMEVMEKYGADAVRYYLMSTPVVAAENLRFAEKEVDEVSKKFITILRNVLAFYALYREHDDGRKATSTHVLDVWIFARLEETLSEETTAMESYELDRAARTLQAFVTDLSTWYVRRSRDRMSGKEGVDAQKDALAALRIVLETFAKMLAPFMPFLAELIYQELDGAFAHEQRASVHLESWPSVSDFPKADGGVLEAMGNVRALVSRALEVREQVGIAVKQVLGEATVALPSGELEKPYCDVFADEVNVKNVIVTKGDCAVTLSADLTPELIREGMVREVTRKVNGMRKEVGLTIQDRITLFVSSEHPDVKKMLEEYGATLKADTLASVLEFGRGNDLLKEDTLRIHERDMVIGFKVA
jgi:isoleucyl-tRNA synthetase